jgi:hypothetical protein
MEPLFPFQRLPQTFIRVLSHFTNIPSPYGVGTACAFAGYFVRHLPLYSVLPQARGLRHQSSSWCTQLYWVGTGRVAFRYVSPCPPLDPYVRLSPHTAHDRGTFTGNFHFANSTERSPWSACAFVGYLCIVAPPSPSGPSPSVLILVYPAFLDSDYYAPFDCLQGLGAFGPGLPSLLPTLLTIPVRLSRVQHGGL